MSILEITDIVGIIAFALSGYWIAAEQKLDILGAFIVSFLTALGGGVLRDVIVNHIPFSFTHLLPSLLVIFVVFIAYFGNFKRFFDFQKKSIFIISDAIGLVSFSITGSMVAIDSELNFFGVLLLALVTAVGGGVMRDILLNRVPLLLSQDFYGSVALVAGSLIYVANALDILGSFSVTLIFLFALILRVYAYKRSWHLPRI